MRKKGAFLIPLLAIGLSGALQAQSWMLADITQPVQTDFGLYHPYQVSITPSVPSYSVAPDFSNVANFSKFHFSPEAQAKLRDNGFVVEPTHFKQAYDVYNFLQSENIPLFVTTDAMLHTFHILFDYALRVMEAECFYPDIQTLTESLLGQIQNFYQGISDDSLKRTALLDIAFLSVARRLLNPYASIPPLVSDLVQAELNLIEAHGGFSRSPIFGYKEDYSQYKPRGHYTRSDTLRRYFQGMMWYGRMMFRLRPDTTDARNSKGIRETRQALLLCKALDALSIHDEPAQALWERVYQPTVFYVGKTDDLSFLEYFPLIQDVFGVRARDLPFEVLADTVAVSAFIEEALRLRDPRINSSFVWEYEDFVQKTKGFRFMGQRFIPDSYMFWQLVHPQVWQRFLPKGLDVMTILGSPRAWEILTHVYHEDRFPYYQTQMQLLKEEFQGLTPYDWAQNLYWNWLYCLMPLLFPKGEGFPAFMRNEAWADKELNTALGSWSELRHDTILYAKQSYTGLTGVPTLQLTRGYVEPNPWLYSRLASLARFMREGLQSRGLLHRAFGQKLRGLESLLLWLKQISEKELTNQPLTEQEYYIVWTIGERLQRLTTFGSDDLYLPTNDTDENMAVIADVHTDPNTGEVLEVGVGFPWLISVVCPVEGQLVVAQGAIFSYYEFPWPMNNRLTDEEWQDLLTSDSPISPPKWMASFRDTTARWTIPYVVKFDPVITAVEQPLPPPSPPVPEGFQLEPSYPNPLIPEHQPLGTTIRFSLPQAAPQGTDGSSRTFEVRLVLYNLLGQKVRTLVEGVRSPGRHAVRWDGRDEAGHPLPAGIYLCRLQVRTAKGASVFQEVQKVALVR